VGVGSAETPAALKRMLWNQMAGEAGFKNKLKLIRHIVSLDELNELYIPMILDGKVTGRIVVDLQK
jgi:hypothetical protein